MIIHTGVASETDMCMWRAALPSLSLSSPCRLTLASLHFRIFPFPWAKAESWWPHCGSHCVLFPLRSRLYWVSRCFTFQGLLLDPMPVTSTNLPPSRLYRIFSPAHGVWRGPTSNIPRSSALYLTFPQVATLSRKRVIGDRRLWEHHASNENARGFLPALLYLHLQCPPPVVSSEPRSKGLWPSIVRSPFAVTVIPSIVKNRISNPAAAHRL